MFSTKLAGTTYAYRWDTGGDQRLLSMALNGVTQVAFTYDSLGRMLTRTPYSAGVAQTPTNFEWEGPMIAREFAPPGIYRYYAPQGEMVTFDYTPTAGATSTYCLHNDAIRSIRAITDSTGSIVAHYETDPWGNILASSSDISFGFNYRFVGSAGVRWDATLGMYYMFQRWYSPDLGRFVSRDPIGWKGGANLYSYAKNRPTDKIDPDGLFVDYERAGKTIYLTIPIAYCNDKEHGFTDEEFKRKIAQINQEIIDTWGGEHDGYDVRIKIITYTEDCLCDEDARYKRAHEIKRMNHIRLLNEYGDSSHMARGVGNLGDWRVGDPPPNMRPPKTGGHEGGHALGVKDNYSYDDPHAKPPTGHEDDIMSNYWPSYRQGGQPHAMPGQVQAIVDYWESAAIREQVRAMPRLPAGYEPR